VVIAAQPEEGSHMRNGWLLAVMVAAALTGCAGLRQFPDVSQDYDAALGELDKEYQVALKQLYPDQGDAPNTEQQIRIRKRFLETRMAVIDAHFKKFEAGLVKENVRVDFGMALIGIGVGAAGSLVAQTASQILSAVSGGLAGAQAAYGKAVLYDKAMAALVAQMHAGRKVIAAQIYERWGLDPERYPLWMARIDLDAYFFAGSLPGAILATAGDATVKEKEAEAILLRPITEEAVTPEMFRTRSTLVTTIDGLEGDKAKALVAKIGAAFPHIRPFLAAQYPPATADADPDGTTARTVLKRAAVLTVRSREDVDKWQSALEGL
jgi:hypothetical protein